jgi:hypothetical protein
MPDPPADQMPGVAGQTAFLTNAGGFGDDQARTCALGIVGLEAAIGTCTPSRARASAGPLDAVGAWIAPSWIDQAGGHGRLLSLLALFALTCGYGLHCNGFMADKEIQRPLRLPLLR